MAAIRGRQGEACVAPPCRIGLLAGGQTEAITGDAYAGEHHCALWDSLRPGG